MSGWSCQGAAESAVLYCHVCWSYAFMTHLYCDKRTMFCAQYHTSFCNTKAWARQAQGHSRATSSLAGFDAPWNIRNTCTDPAGAYPLVLESPPTPTMNTMRSAGKPFG
jgi:hypothetical protein